MTFIYSQSFTTITTTTTTTKNDNNNSNHKNYNNEYMCFPNPYFVFSTPSNPLVDGILTCFMIFLFDLNTFD